ncbi:MAG: amylo-alpha-1,6-glucosidase [Chloroflexota bacterium]
MAWSEGVSPEDEQLMTHEWLVTNGLGGYASSTVSGISTRRYHGLLIAALPAPLGRVEMLSHVSEELRLPGGATVQISRQEHAGEMERYRGPSCLVEFRLDVGLPVWRYKVGRFVLEKRVYMPYMQNTVYVDYRLVSGAGSVCLILRPEVRFRAHETPVSEPLTERYRLMSSDDRYELIGEDTYPTLRLLPCGDGWSFSKDEKVVSEILYRVEEIRGYDAVGDLWSPGTFRIDLEKGRRITLVASTESWDVMEALRPAEALAAENERRRRLLASAHPRARSGFAAQLVFAADQFIIIPAGRVADSARAHAAGDDVRTVIAGYHWFTDWGRDTMISLEGLALATGRVQEAGYILRTFAYYIRDGLIPNMFPEGEKEGVYNTADATLWFFHALDRYIEATGDRETLKVLLPKLLDIVDHHLKGTRFGIGVDPEDGLLRQGIVGLPLTWMDAHVGDWVVTPRRGKAVEINALWYNALRLLERWVRDEYGEEMAEPLAQHASRVRRSFNARFWYEDGGYLYDVVDGENGDDPSCRPNQILAISLRHPVLDRVRWESVLQVVLERLVTPVGLRSLAPDHPEYKPMYCGDLRCRDGAYHQGTVWAWLIGPFIDAWLKLYPEDRVGARRFLDGFRSELAQVGVGSISEIFDADPPFTPRGCIAQAWSVAEVLRCWAKTAES